MPRNKNTTHRVRAHIMQMVAEASVPNSTLKAQRRSIDREIDKAGARARAKLTDALVAQPAITIVPGSPTELKRLLELIYQAGWMDYAHALPTASYSGNKTCKKVLKRLGLT